MNNDQAQQQHEDGLPNDCEVGPLTEQEKQMAQYELEQKMLDALQDGPSTGHYEPTAEELEWEKASEAERMRIAQRCEPTQEEIEQMAEESARLAAERREQDSRAPRAVPGSYDQPFRVRESMPNDLHEKFHTVTRCTTGDEFTHAEAQLEMLLDMIKVRLVEVIKDDPFTDWGITFLIESENVGIPSGHYRY